MAATGIRQTSSCWLRPPIARRSASGVTRIWRTAILRGATLACVDIGCTSPGRAPGISSVVAAAANSAQSRLFWEISTLSERDRTAKATRKHSDQPPSSSRQPRTTAAIPATPTARATSAPADPAHLHQHVQPAVVGGGHQPMGLGADVAGRDGVVQPEGAVAEAQPRMVGELAEDGGPDVGAPGQGRVLAQQLQRRVRGQPQQRRQALRRSAGQEHRRHPPPPARAAPP